MSPRALLVWAWVLAIACLGTRYARARWVFTAEPTDPAHKHRADGHAGHTEIDFGGQWLFGRMLATGHARELYDRNHQWEVARAGFRRADESPDQQERAFPEPPGEVRYRRGKTVHHDADWIMYWLMGRDSPRWADAGRAVVLPFAGTDPLSTAVYAQAANAALTDELVKAVNVKAVGGPLYPPIHAFYYAPLGAIDRPAVALHVFQVIYLLVGLLTGLGISKLSDGRIWWPVATAGVCLFTGFRAGVELGQNPAFSLCILVWGWVLAARGRDAAGGMVWGLLAFKPVWAVSFLLVPLLLRRWRFAAAMAGTGLALILLTLPFVGLQAWFDWLTVGREAAFLYKVNRTWVFISRDLFGLPRRVLLDFELPESERDRADAEAIGWLLWLLVLGVTAFVTWTRADRKATVGPAVSLPFLGAYLGCYRFMYYDALIAGAAVAVLFADPRVGGRRSFPVWVLIALFVQENLFVQRDLHFLAYPDFNTGVRWPWDTLILLILWAWLVRRVWRSDPPQRP